MRLHLSNKQKQQADQRLASGIRAAEGRNQMPEVIREVGRKGVYPLRGRG